MCTQLSKPDLIETKFCGFYPPSAFVLNSGSHYPLPQFLCQAVSNLATHGPLTTVCIAWQRVHAPFKVPDSQYGTEQPACILGNWTMDSTGTSQISNSLLIKSMASCKLFTFPVTQVRYLWNGNKHNTINTRYRCVELCKAPALRAGHPETRKAPLSHPPTLSDCCGTFVVCTSDGHT